jgi:hypothetical protein
MLEVKPHNNLSSTRDELPYWRTTLEEIQTCHRIALELVEAIVEVPVTALELVWIPDPHGRLEKIGEIQAQARNALRLVGDLHGPLAMIGEVAAGRAVALDAEAEGSEE